MHQGVVCNAKPDGGLLHGIRTVDRGQVVSQNLLRAPRVNQDTPLILILDPDARCDGVPQSILGLGT